MLFQQGNFTLASGAMSRWKIECDALTPGDWMALAAMAAEILPPFVFAYGVPRGGLPFANALNQYAKAGNHPVLIADDVWTTGGSVRRFAASTACPNPKVFGPPICVVAFARGPYPAWVTPLFRMPAAVPAVEPVDTAG